MTSDRDLKRDIARALHLDLFVANNGLLPTTRRQVLLGIVWIKLLQIKILNVWTNIGEPPGNTIVVADYDARQTRRGDAGYANARRIQMDQVPDRRGGGAQMWIVGEERLAGRRQLTANHPVITCGEGLGVETDSRQSVVTDCLRVCQN